MGALVQRTATLCKKKRGDARSLVRAALRAANESDDDIERAMKSRDMRLSREDQRSGNEDAVRRAVERLCAGRNPELEELAEVAEVSPYDPRTTANLFGWMLGRGLGEPEKRFLADQIYESLRITRPWKRREILAAALAGAAVEPSVIAIILDPPAPEPRD